MIDSPWEICYKQPIRGVAQLASALALGARGPGFESLLPDLISRRDSNPFESSPAFSKFKLAPVADYTSSSKI